MEKTELEKRWEAELKDEEVKEPVSFEEGLTEKDDEEASHLIFSPFSEDTPVVLLSSNNKLFVGGLDLGYSNESAQNMSLEFCSITYPIAYIESLEKSGNNVVLTPVMRRILFGIQLPEFMFFRTDMLYFLRNNSDKDIALYNYYCNTVKESKLQDARIHSPSSDEVSVFGRKDENHTK